MRYYASHDESFAFWYTHGAKGLEFTTPVNLPSIERATASAVNVAAVDFPSRAGIRLPGVGEIGCVRRSGTVGADCAGRHHVLVGQSQQRRNSPGVCRHEWRGALPAHSFREVSQGVLVSSPEFTFLQLARDLDLIDAALVGMSLCSCYRLVPDINGISDTIVECQPVTSAETLRRYLDGAAGIHGVSRARDALALVEDRSRSPMETETFAMAAWPTKLGGYGFSQIKLNYRVPVEPQNVDVSDRPDRQYVKVDLYDPKAQAGIEYLGSWHREQWNEDLRRLNMLSVMGKRILYASADLVRRPAEFALVMRQFARHCGVDAPALKGDRAVLHDTLRRLLEGPGRLRL